MENYKVVVNRSNGEQFSDELQHHKYIKREKKNGKWVYTYSKTKTAKVSDLPDEVKTEISRKAQDVKYAAKDAELKYKTEKAMKKNEFGKIAKTSVQRGSNHVMRTLNKFGKGTLDDRLKESANRGKNALRESANRGENAFKGAAKRGKNALRKFLEIH